ncbi:MAG: YdbL family protein [Ectothiorhodospiraceae bacterium]|nr:YdbL family protein [Chromatiales bacterium]MCP5157122.1 YdbL family protein [Ectothiorhodospiraceae bacterium]
MLVLGALALGACVTINVYFPAAAAERAADRIIEEVWGEREGEPQARKPATPTSAVDHPALRRLVGLALSALVRDAVAQQPDFDVATPAVRKLTSSMKARYPSLEPFYASGAVGLGGDGRVVLRDPKAVPLAQRGTVNTLVAEENRDRDALYAEIARANGHPEWEPEVRATFARRWIEQAKSGWWYRTASGWSQR